LFFAQVIDVGYNSITALFSVLLLQKKNPNRPMPYWFNIIFLPERNFAAKFGSELAEVASARSPPSAEMIE